MIQQTITYLQRDTRTEDEHGFPQRYHLNAEKERVAKVPTFVELREQFGRCEGKVFRDTGSGAIHCGYVFAKRERWYDQSIGWDDPRQFYTQETWVTFENVETTPLALSTHEPTGASC